MATDEGTANEAVMTGGGPDAGGGSRAPASLEALFLANLDLIDRVVGMLRRSHGMTLDEAEEFGATLRAKMVEDGYGVFARFEGRSPLASYLTVVIQRMYLDYRNQMWGKWRPSIEAVRLGPLAVQLDRLLTRDGLELRDAAQILRARFGDAAKEDALHAIAERLPARTNRRARTVPLDDSVLGTRQAASDPERDAIAAEEAAERDAVLEAVHLVLAELPSEDRLILRLRLEQGAQVSEIARVLQIPQRPLYRRLEHLLRDVRGRLAQRGITGASLPASWWKPEPETPSDGPSRKSSRSRPSMSMWVRRRKSRRGAGPARDRDEEDVP